jgi:hypothetical protein
MKTKNPLSPSGKPQDKTNAASVGDANPTSRKSDHSTAELQAIEKAALDRIKINYDFSYSLIHTTANSLLRVRETYIYRAKYMANDLLASAKHLDETGRLPNGCGETQGASQIENYNGEIHALTSTLNSLLSQYPL